LSSLPGKGFIGVKITGLNEILTSITNMQREWPVVRSAVLNEAGRFLANEAKRNVHVVSGDLKNSIGIEPGPPRSSVIVSAKMPYAKKENDRPGDKHATQHSKPPYGPHDYFTRAINATSRDFQSRIKINFDKLLTRHKTRS